MYVANHKYKNKKLVSVSNDDSVEEADALADAVRELETLRAELHSEAEKVAGLEADLKARDEEHSSLEQRHKALTEELADLRTTDVDHVAALEKAEVELRARQDYLQTASEEITGLLTKIAEQDKTRTQLDEQYAELQRQVEEQRSSIAEKDAALEAATRELENARREPQTSSGEDPPEIALANSSGSDIGELQAQIARTEDYADTLRQTLNDLTASYDEVVLQRDRTSRSLERMTKQNAKLSEEIAKADLSIAETQAAIEQQQTEQRATLDHLQADYETDIDKLRSELSEAQDALTEATDTNEGLAADLMHAQKIKDDLESALSDSEERAKDRIEELEKEVRLLTRTSEDFEHKLDTRSTAIHALLGELAKKSERLDSISEIEAVVREIDDRMPNRPDDESAPEEIPSEDHIVLAGDDTDRRLRAMIATVGNKVLRFPLFKDRVTIGRTKENDIRLKTSYVSRQHAVVLIENDCTRVIDSGSRNGVFVNSRRIKEHALSNGDVVTVGDAKLRYVERHEQHA